MKEKQSPINKIQRRDSKEISVGSVIVGGSAPISVQTMTNTLTKDAKKTLLQIENIEQAGADIVRVSCPDKDSTSALREIVKQSSIPVIADIHFNHKRAIESAQAGAACLRINPGNIGKKERVIDVIKAAKDYNCSMRIGVNAGSLDKHILDKYHEPCPEAMVESALHHIKILEDLDFFNFKISVKASNLFLATDSYRLLSRRCKYPLHLGITEAGTKRSGTVLSAIGIGTLLWEGIGDTLRVSLSTDPVEEVKVGFDILKSLDLRHRGVRIVACPSCARQGFNVNEAASILEEKLAHITTPITLSILGCVVNGPGEARESNIGIVGAIGDKNIIYIDGKKDHFIGNKNLIDHTIHLVETYIATINKNIENKQL